MRPHRPRRATASRAASATLVLLTAACGHVAPTGQPAATAPGGLLTPSGTATGDTAADTPPSTPTRTAAPTPVRAAATPPTDPWAPVSVPARAWGAWHLVPTGIRLASSADEATMRRRARAVLGRDWTMEAGPGVVITHRSGQTRLRVGTPEAWDLEVHLPPAPATEQGWPNIDRRPAAICSRKAGSCLRLPIVQRPDRPGLELATQMAWMEAVDRLALQESPLDLLPPAGAGGPPLGVARTDSPVGPLDCLLAAGDDRRLTALEGRPLAVWGASPQAAAVCLDRRGMVVVAPSGVLVAPPVYTVLRAGADPTTGSLPLPLSQ